MIGRRIVFLFILKVLSVKGQLQDIEQECNILKTLDSLQSRIEEQDGRLREQELNLSEQTIEVRELETRLREKDANIIQLDARLGEKDTQISRLETDMGDKESRIGGLETLIGEQKTEIASLKQRLDSVRAVGFSARRPKQSPSSTGQMAFSQIFTNAGGAYDANAGVFSCPVAGTYFFCATLLKEHSYNSYAACNIFKTNVNLARAFTDPGSVGGSYAHYPAVTAVYVRLAVGDTVKLSGCTDIGASFNIESSFSGFLVTPDPN